MKRLGGEKRGSLGEPFEKGIRIFSLMFPGNISCLFYFDSPGSKVSIINFDNAKRQSLILATVFSLIHLILYNHLSKYPDEKLYKFFRAFFTLHSYFIFHSIMFVSSWISLTLISEESKFIATISWSNYLFFCLII